MYVSLEPLWYGFFNLEIFKTSISIVKSPWYSTDTLNLKHRWEWISKFYVYVRQGMHIWNTKYARNYFTVKHKLICSLNLLYVLSWMGIQANRCIHIYVCIFPVPVEAVIGAHALKDPSLWATAASHDTLIPVSISISCEIVNGFWDNNRLHWKFEWCTLPPLSVDAGT